MATWYTIQIPINAGVMLFHLTELSPLPYPIWTTLTHSPGLRLEASPSRTELSSLECASLTPWTSPS